jgi:hypothetical protein
MYIDDMMSSVFEFGLKNKKTRVVRGFQKCQVILHFHIQLLYTTTLIISIIPILKVINIMSFLLAVLLQSIFFMLVASKLRMNENFPQQQHEVLRN